MLEGHQLTDDNAKRQIWKQLLRSLLSHGTKRLHNDDDIGMTEIKTKCPIIIFVSSFHGTNFQTLSVVSKIG